MNITHALRTLGPKTLSFPQTSEQLMAISFPRTAPPQKAVRFQPDLCLSSVVSGCLAFLRQVLQRVEDAEDAQMAQAVSGELRTAEQLLKARPRFFWGLQPSSTSKAERRAKG